MWPIKERYLEQKPCPVCDTEAGPCESILREWSDGYFAETRFYHASRDSPLGL